MVAVNIVIGQGSALGWLSPTVIGLSAVFVVAASVFLQGGIGQPRQLCRSALFQNKTYSGATLSNFLLNGAAGTLLVALALVQQAAGLVLHAIRTLDCRLPCRHPEHDPCRREASPENGRAKADVAGLRHHRDGNPADDLHLPAGAANTWLLPSSDSLSSVSVWAFTPRPSTDAALSNVPNDKAGAASGIYKMASSLGSAFGVAISAAIFTGLSHLQGFGPIADIAMGRTDNINVRFAAAWR